MAAGGGESPQGVKSNEKAFHPRWAPWTDILNLGQHFLSYKPLRSVLGRANVFAVHHPSRVGTGGGRRRPCAEMPSMGFRPSERILPCFKPFLPIAQVPSLPKIQLSPSFTEEGMKSDPESLGVFHI